MKFKHILILLIFIIVQIPSVSAETSKIVFTLPADGYSDNTELFTFYTYYEIPYIAGGKVTDYTVSVTGGNAGYNYGPTSPITLHNVSRTGNIYKGYFNFYRAMNVGSNTITVTITHPNGFSVSNSISVNRESSGQGDNGGGSDVDFGGNEQGELGQIVPPLPTDYILPDGWDDGGKDYFLIFEKKDEGYIYFYSAPYPFYVEERSIPGYEWVIWNMRTKGTHNYWRSLDGYNWTAFSHTFTLNSVMSIVEGSSPNRSLLASNYDVCVGDWYDGSGYVIHFDQVYFRQTVDSTSVSGGTGGSVGGGDPSLYFTLPRDGFIDNAQFFTFYTVYDLPFTDITANDINISVTGGIDDYDYGTDNPILHNSIEKTDTGLRGYLNFYRAVEEGENTITVTVTVPGKDVTLTKSINVTRLAGFVDEDGDGLDDRTGRPDGNYELGVRSSSASALLTLIENKLGTAQLKNTFTALSDLHVGVIETPVIKLPLGEIMNTVSSRFDFPNPFADGEYELLNFGYLDELEFGGTSVINYFRMIISAGLIWFTINYVWKKIIPNEAVM